MTGILQTLWNIIKAPFLDGYTAFVAALNVLASEIPNDEIAIAIAVKQKFLDDLNAGKSWGEAVADGLTALVNAEGRELSKVTTYLVQAFFAKFEPPAVAA